MALDEFITKVRSWDNRCQRWLMRGAFFIFFEFVLAFVFFVLLFNALKFLDLSARADEKDMVQQLLLQQTNNGLIIIGLLVLNSFWMLYMFSGINRLRLILKDISYSLMRRRQNGKPDSDGF